jgi:2-C-methyl-D-erythritol 4-phosphate cytidylyltransferase
MPSTRTRRARRTTWTSCWRSASAPQRRPPSTSASAVIAAAGSGERLGAGGPKAFVELAGKPLLDWSLDALKEAGTVTEVVVATPPGHEEAVAGRGVLAVAGGEHRSESVANALEVCGEEIVVVHDAARPLVTPKLINAVIERLASDEEAAGAIAAAPVTDTVKQATDAGQVERTLDRSGLWAVQTPQAFRADALREALSDLDALPEATDDAMLVERRGGRILIHSAPAENLKVTTALDLRVAELLLRERS